MFGIVQSDEWTEHPGCDEKTEHRAEEKPRAQRGRARRMNQPFTPAPAARRDPCGDKGEKHEDVQRKRRLERQRDGEEVPPPADIALAQQERDSPRRGDVRDLAHAAEEIREPPVAEIDEDDGGVSHQHEHRHGERDRTPPLAVAPASRQRLEQQQPDQHGSHDQAAVLDADRERAGESGEHDTRGGGVAHRIVQRVHAHEHAEGERNVVVGDARMGEDVGKECNQRRREERRSGAQVAPGEEISGEHREGPEGEPHQPRDHHDLLGIVAHAPDERARVVIARQPIPMPSLGGIVVDRQVDRQAEHVLREPGMIVHEGEIAEADAARADGREHDLVECGRRAQHRATREDDESQCEQREKASVGKPGLRCGRGAHGR